MAQDLIEVSPEMTAWIGGGAPATATPPGWVTFRFDLRGTATFSYERGDDDGHDLALIVAADACVRIFGGLPDAAGRWHLPAEPRAIALEIRDCALPAPARATLRLAKCIELLCATFVAIGDGTLVPVADGSDLSELDAARIVAARRLIDEQWREKLTLDGIARACGTNRAKLTRGFRAMFATTVADAIAERRLGGARQMLLATDLPVSSIGYACGYLNNAAFTRAFSRRYGMAPTRLRTGMAA